MYDQRNIMMIDDYNKICKLYTNAPAESVTVRIQVYKFFVVFDWYSQLDIWYARETL